MEETRLHSGSVAAPQDKPAAIQVPWVEIVILLVAAWFRWAWIEIKPPHFDEGVNGWFIDRIQETGFYSYDPTNFHGPLHFYLLFVAQVLFGREVWAIRLPVVLFSLACVWLAMAFRPYFGRRVCAWAALGLALSPAATFYGRYAIHETELLLFLMLTAWGLLGLARFGKARHLWAAALGVTGCILTKETYLIHFIAFGLAVPALLLLERLTGGKRALAVPQRWTSGEAAGVGAVCVGLLMFFYSGGFLDWGALPGMITTFFTWVKTGTDAEGGHNKAWYYWLELLWRYEWPALLGLVASAWYVLMSRQRALRWFILSGWAAFFAYSIIRYKTPWCLLCIYWPFFFVLGRLLEEVRRRWPVYVVAGVAAVVFGHSALSAIRVNFRKFTDETEPYVYVQTTLEVNKLLQPLRQHVALDPVRQHLSGYVLIANSGSHPLPWLLGGFPNIRILQENQAQESMDADVLVIDSMFAGDVEDRLHEPYFRENIVIRGQSGESAELYFRAATFGYLFPGRTAEFMPRPPIEAAPAPVHGTPEPTVRELEAGQPAPAVP